MTPGRPASGPSRTAVIVGARGFLGSHVCDAFVRACWQVTAPDRTACDVGLGDLLARVRPAVVVNAAGAVWTANENLLRTANVELPRRLVAAVAALPGPPRLLHLGSSLEYAPTRPGTSCHETSPVGPTSAYGRSKLDGTRTVLEAAAQGRLDGVILRVFNAVGPGVHPVSLLGRIAARLRQARDTGRTPVAIPLPAPVHHRDFVDVRDVADAVVAAAGARLNGATLLNIGRGQALGTDQVVRAFSAASGVPATFITPAEAPSGANGFKAAGPSWQQAATSRARSLLDWRPTRPLDRTFRDTWLHTEPQPTEE
ncbi:NAD-dependent epimerase/dehydratase family protein [Streptomyces albus]|uniref:NAD-dependent epimerase/dehydratase family protein n=1 Tax=Streptomyces albus TaxID=1888 RepID=UPI003F199DC2